MTLHVEVTGGGPDLVLLHGWGANLAVWSELVGELSSHFRLHAVDLPGYGTSKPCDPYSLQQMVAMLTAEMPRSCLVCGWSLGGQLALAWASIAPRQIARIALIATTPCFVQRDDWPHAVPVAVWNDFSKELAVDGVGTIKRFIALQALGDIGAKRVVKQMRRVLGMHGVPDLRVLESGLRILLETDLRVQLPGIAQPTLVLHGERDMVAPFAAGEYLSHALPDSRLISLPGVGHAPLASNAGTVYELLRHFFDVTHERPA